MKTTYQMTPTGWLCLYGGTPIAERIGDDWTWYGSGRPLQPESAARLTFALVKWLAACLEPKETT